MAGLNYTGGPDTGDYNLGRGKLFLASLASGLPDDNGFRDLGNCPEFNVSVEVETLEHQSSREGLKTTDKEVVISQKVSLTFQVDELNFQNMALFFSGESTAAGITNPAIAGVTSEALLTLSPDVTLGGVWIDLAAVITGTRTRIYDIAAANLSVTEDPGGTPVVLVQGTDYTVDEKMGRIFLLSTGGLTSGVAVEFTLAADAGAVNPDEVRALTQTNVIAALKFIGQNPANNDQQIEYQFHQVQLKADGDFALIGDDWTTMSFTAVAEKNLTADADSPTVTIRTHANA